MLLFLRVLNTPRNISGWSPSHCEFLVVSWIRRLHVTVSASNSTDLNVATPSQFSKLGGYQNETCETKQHFEVHTAFRLHQYKQSLRPCSGIYLQDINMDLFIVTLLFYLDIYLFFLLVL